jgi:hypothetical protein
VYLLRPAVHTERFNKLLGSPVALQPSAHACIRLEANVPIKLNRGERHRVALLTEAHTHTTDVSDFGVVLHIVMCHSC